MWRIKSLVSAALCVLMLAGCAGKQEPVVEQTFPTAPEATYKTVEAVRGDFVLSESVSAVMVFPETETLVCEFPNAIVESAITWRAGEEIKAGDVIATFTFEVSQAHRKKLELSCQEARRVMAEQSEAYERQIAELEAMSSQEGLAGSVAALQKVQKQNDYALYRRSAEADLSLKEKEYAEYCALFEKQTLTAPRDGYVTWCSDYGEGVVLGKGTAILSYFSAGQKLLMAKATGKDILRCGTPGMTVTISDGSRSVPGTIISTPAGVDELEGKQEILISSDQLDDLARRSSYQIQCELLRIEDAIMLDRRAIQKKGSSNYVLILENGEVVRQNVLLGQENDDVVCILDGLQEGQQVVIF